MAQELKEVPEDDLAWIEQYNEENMVKARFNQNENENVTSIMMNYPALLLRKKSLLYPNGRTSVRFKAQLRKLVTVVG